MQSTSVPQQAANQENHLHQFHTLTHYQQLPTINQKQALLIRQLEDELRLAHETRIRTNDADIQQHIDALCLEKENLFKENCLLRDTIRELEMRIETQKQTLSVRDESIKKMVEMMNNKGIASKLMEDERVEMDRIKTRNIELEARLRHYETIIENKEKELIKVSGISLFLSLFQACFYHSCKISPFSYFLPPSYVDDFQLPASTNRGQPSPSASFVPQKLISRHFSLASQFS